MIPTKTITDSANALITSGNLTDNQYAQLAGASAALLNAAPRTVASVSALPSAAANKSLLFYVTSVQQYYFSDGVAWRNDFSSKSEVFRAIAYAWGRGYRGVLGNNTESNPLGPVTVVGDLTTWTMVSAGPRHSLGLTSTGIAYAWGENSGGQLGDNTTSNRSSPVTVAGGITNWRQLASGVGGNSGQGRYSLGLTSTGIAYGWGSNNLGQLGDNTTSFRSSPVTVVGGITNWIQLAGGGDHSLGLTSTGIAYGWGRNGNGQLGDNSTGLRSSPVTVVGGITNWSQLAGGFYHSLGLTSAGVAYAWGENSDGRLGNNTTSNRSSPVTVVGGITNWSQLSGGVHSLGLTSTGIAYGWGSNNLGQLGDSTTTSRSSPVTVVGGITNWSQVSAGFQHSLGVTNAGFAYGWGSNDWGQLGDNTTSYKTTPVLVAGGITNWSQVSAGFQHSLGIPVLVPVTKGFV